MPNEVAEELAYHVGLEHDLENHIGKVVNFVRAKLLESFKNGIQAAKFSKSAGHSQKQKSRESK